MKKIIAFIVVVLMVCNACKKNKNLQPSVLTVGGVQVSQPGKTSEFYWSIGSSLPLDYGIVKYRTYAFTTYKDSTLDIISTNAIYHFDDKNFITPLSGFMNFHFKNITKTGTYKPLYTAGDFVAYNLAGIYRTNEGTGADVKLDIKTIDVAKRIISGAFTATLINVKNPGDKVLIRDANFTTTY